MTSFYCIMKDGKIWDRTRKNSLSRLYDDKVSAERALFWAITHNLRAENESDITDFRLDNSDEYKRYSIGKIDIQTEDQYIDETENTSYYNECINGIIFKILSRTHRYTGVNDFWYHLVKLGVSRDVKYIAKVIPKVEYMNGSKRQKTIRDSIKLLGLKSNRYRMKGDFVAFMSKEDATSARLCINCNLFINIEDIRTRAINML